MIKLLTVFGTRPEAVKMCPLVLELRKHKEIRCVICLTGQHREMLDQVMGAFGVEADHDLNIMKTEQSLTGITTSVLTGMERVLEEEKPDMVLVHGDTTTSYAAALAAFYKRIPVGHVVAGLRTGNIYYPYPEEMNRLLTDRISAMHFAPTELNRRNLENEGITKNVYVTGNTVIDSFAYTVREGYVYHNEMLNKVDFDNRRVILVTAHRRENIGKPLESICNAVKELSYKYEDIRIIYPVHLNPAVRDTVFEMLSGTENIMLTDPVDVFDMHNMMSHCYMVMTDSGGLQEEAPHFGKPVMVLRTETERPEAVEAGTVKVVGVNTDNIIYEAKRLLDNKDVYNSMAQAVNPYGDGHACERIAEAIVNI